MCNKCKVEWTFLNALVSESVHHLFDMNSENYEVSTLLFPPLFLSVDFLRILIPIYLSFAKFKITLFILFINYILMCFFNL